MDLSKFRRDISKNLNLSLGFNDPKVWIGTGNYALNYYISSDFNKGIPLGKVTIFAGQPGSGKSYIAAGNIVRQAQSQGIVPIIIDTENALDEAWLQALGVDTSEEKLIRAGATFVDDVADFITSFMAHYKASEADKPREQREKYVFIIDSLSMLLTKSEVEQFEKGDLKGDMGRLPKQLKALVKRCVNMFGNHDIGLVCTNHTYQSQDMFDPDDKISGGTGIIYAASIVVAMQKRKLKKDEDGNKTPDVRGIRSEIKVVKSRYAKPFEKVEINIPWETGMDPYSGLVDFFKARGVLEKDHTKLKYIDKNGTEHKYYEKEIGADLLDLMMKEWQDLSPVVGVGAEKTDDEDDE